MKPRLREIRCIYCTELKLPPKKKGEHIILDGLGGHATILDVCKECNQWLGDNLDVEFLRNSHIAFYRYFDPAIDDGQIGKIQFVPSQYGWWDAKMHNSGQLEVKRQVGITDAQWVMVGRIDQQDEFEKSLAELKGTDPDYTVCVRDIDKHEPARLVFSGKRHLIRARSNKDVQKVKDAIKKGHVPGKPMEPWDLEGTNMHVAISTDPHAIGRCVAKMAFNMATAVFGAQTMLDSAFDPVREYIRGNNVIEVPPEVLPDGEIAVTLDERYVDNWLNRERGGQPRGPTTEHCIELRKVRSKLGAIVTLIGGCEQFVVTLGPLDNIADEKLPVTLWCRKDDDYWGRDNWWMPNEKMKRHLERLNLQKDRS